jgi:predicted nucleotidyltransferase
MTRSEAIARLSQHADALRARGATSLYLFGSAARDEAGDRSDLDVFLDYDPSMNFSLIDPRGHQGFPGRGVGYRSRRDHER